MYNSIEKINNIDGMLKLSKLPGYSEFKHLIPEEPKKIELIVNCDTAFINLIRQTIIGKLKRKILHFNREDYNTNNHLLLPYMGLLIQFSQIYFDQTKDITTSFYAENTTTDFIEYTVDDLSIKLEDYNIQNMYTLGMLSSGDFINIRKIYTKESDKFMLVESWEYEDLKYDGNGEKKSFINNCIQHKLSFSSRVDKTIIINRTIDFITNSFKKFRKTVVSTNSLKFKFDGDEGGYGYMMEVYAITHNIRLKSQRFFYEIDIYTIIEVRSKDSLLTIVDECIKSFEKFRVDFVKKN